MSDAENTAGQDEQKAKRPLLWGCLTVGVLVIAIPAACTAALSAGGSNDWEPTAREARLICEDWVRDQLKAPSTARFTDGATDGSGGDYVVTGSVDAENSFGADIRTEWRCDVEYRESDERWHGRAALEE